MKEVYMSLLQEINDLHESMRGLHYKFLNLRPVIFVGISNHSIRIRCCNNHFGGTARKSTLRKSLGVLYGLRKEWFPHEINTCRYRFIDKDEECLSKCMKTHLIINYYVFENLGDIEREFIEYFNPPLNLMQNNNNINGDFRTMLLELRCRI